MLMQTGLAPIEGSNLFIRISSPNDPYLDIDTMVFIESEYKIPFFHLRTQTEIENPKNSMLSSPEVINLK